MPHLDYTHFFNLIFWCNLTILLLYYTAIKEFCYKISCIINERKKIIKFNIEKQHNINKKLKKVEERSLLLLKETENKIQLTNIYLDKKEYNILKNISIQHNQILEHKKQAMQEDILKFSHNVKKIIIKHNKDIELSIIQVLIQ